MQTSVFSQILYHSLRGEQMYGGTLSVDELIVPTEEVGPANGRGSIDGKYFDIGFNSPINSVRAKSIIVYPFVSSNFSSFIVKDNANRSLIEISQEDSAPGIKLYDVVGGVCAYISNGVASFTKALIGSNDLNEITQGVNFRAIGYSVMDFLKGQSANFDYTVTAQDFTVPSLTYGFAALGSRVEDELYPWYSNDMLPLDLSGTGRLTNTIVGELGKMGDSTTLSLTQWGYLASMQNVSTASSPIFVNVAATKFSGMIDPSPAGHTISDLEYFIKNYREYPEAAIAYTVGAGWSGTIQLRISVIGKLCTMVITPTLYQDSDPSNSPGLVYISSLAASNSARTEKLKIDFSNSKYSIIMANIGATTWKRPSFEFRGSTQINSNTTIAVNLCAAAPIASDPYLTIGLMGPTVGQETGGSYNCQPISWASSTGGQYLRFYPQTWTWFVA